MNTPHLPEPTRTTRYRCGTTALCFETDDPGAARWMDEVVLPWFESAPGVAVDDVVRLVHDDRSMGALLERFGEDEPRTACFALDTRLLSYPAVRRGGATLVRDEDRQCVYRLDEDGVTVLARAGDRRARLAALRVLRELGFAGRRADHVSLHAAAIEVGGSAVAIAGAKRAGKTTLLTYLLGAAGTRYVANDQLLVDLAPSPPFAAGVPTMLSVRSGTLGEFPELGRGLPGTPSVSHLRLDELAAASRGPGGHDRVRMTSAHFTTRLGAECVRGAPLVAILLPEITTQVDRWELAPLSGREAAARLAAVRYGLGRRPAVRTVFEERTGPRRDDSGGGLLERLSRAVPVVRCRLGPAAYSSRAAAGDLLGEILGLCSTSEGRPG